MPTSIGWTRRVMLAVSGGALKKTLPPEPGYRPAVTTGIEKVSALTHKWTAILAA